MRSYSVVSSGSVMTCSVLSKLNGRTSISITNMYDVSPNLVVSTRAPVNIAPSLLR